MPNKKIFLKIFSLALFLSLTIFFLIKAAPPNTPYLPGETLDPNCAPGETNCTVYPPAISTRQIQTTSPLTGGGDLSQDRTLSLIGLSGLGQPNQILSINSQATALEYKNITSLLSAGSGISISGTDIATISNTGILSLNSLTGNINLQGTTNQINIATSSGTITLSLPQDIALTSSPTFANLTISDTATTTNLNVTGLTNLATTTISTQLAVPKITTLAGNLTIDPAGNLVISKSTSILGDLTVSGTATTTQLSVTSTSTLGTVISGIWQGSVISTAYGGTGLSSLGSANQILGVNSGATGLEYKNIASLLSAGSGISISGAEIATISNTGILSLTAGSGISISSGQNPTISNIGVLSLNSATGTLTLQGTTNQINVATSSGTITLSLPQDIATISSPTFSGLTLSSLTPGSVLFAGSGGIISQDNSNLFWDNTNKRLGIGTSTPAGILHVATGTVNALVVDNNGNVGIGTTAPSEKLEVSGAAKAQFFKISDDYYTLADLASRANLGLAALGKVVNTLRGRPLVSVEYWDGSAWQPWTDSTAANMLDGDYTTDFTFDYTHRKWRIVVDEMNWKRTFALGINKIYTTAYNKPYSIMLETSSDGSTWTLRKDWGQLTMRSLPYQDVLFGITEWGDRYWRITVEYPTLVSGETIRWAELAAYSYDPWYRPDVFQPYGANDAKFRGNVYIPSGNVGIGTTNPGTYKLRVQGTVCFDTNNDGTCDYTWSDIAMKRNIQELSGALGLINQLNPVTFEFRYDEEKFKDFFLPHETQFGLIAQDVEKILPQLVENTVSGYKIVKYEKFVPLLVGAIKEQQKEIEELKLTINQNETKIDPQLLNSLIEAISKSENEDTSLFDKFVSTIKKSLEKLGLFIENGIAKLKEIFAEKVTTKQICLEGDDGETICVDKNQLKQLLQQTTNNAQPTTNNSQPTPTPTEEATPSPTPESSPTPSPSPTPELTPTPESSLTPTPEPTPTEQPTPTPSPSPSSTLEPTSTLPSS
jgi:hypothetical protein